MLITRIICIIFISLHEIDILQQISLMLWLFNLLLGVHDAGLLIWLLFLVDEGKGIYLLSRLLIFTRQIQKICVILRLGLLAGRRLLILLGFFHEIKRVQFCV